MLDDEFVNLHPSTYLLNYRLIYLKHVGNLGLPSMLHATILDDGLQKCQLGFVVIGYAAL